MPKNDIDYSNTIIYKIFCKDPLITYIYVGHTTNFVQRKYAHKQACNNIKSSSYDTKLYKTIRDNGNWSNWEMSIINHYNCKDQIEAKQKEREHIILLDAFLKNTELINTKKILFIDNEENLINKVIPISNTILLNDYTCTQCDKKYSSRNGLWKHKKICVSINNNTKMNNKPVISEEIILNILNQNNDLQQMLIDQNNKMFELAKETKCVTNNTTNNTTNNNHFNLQIYLNETCKDAINLADFIEGLQVKLKDLEETARLGYSEGVSRIFINGLNELDVCKRPIHCSDAKREILYIKDQDEWSKEDTNKTRISKAIKTVGNKNIQQIFEWQKKYPEYNDPESKQSDRYMEMICNTMSGSSKEEQLQNVGKIIKNITKEVVIDKSV